MKDNIAPQYLLRNGLVVQMGADMSLPFITIERAVMSFFGYSEEEDHDAGVAVWSEQASNGRRYITARRDDMTNEQLVEHAQSFGCRALSIMTDYAIAQDLINELNLHISPIIFRNGSLAGGWRVERLSSYEPLNKKRNGIINGVNQPVATESTDLLHAVYATACRVMGLGKQIFIHFPHGAEGEAEFLACDFELVKELAEYVGFSLFYAPSLNMYATLGASEGIPSDVKSAAIEEARIQCRAAMAPSE
ncbi:hypothetical protein [Enterobacter hormaechei]|uniref:hypothetical protein n=1 Tax=Enterobacter hormaechei TaxID=158836 RepID=UPI00115DCEB6|nr:hypothetical protein [Enterobacter hormaechei]